MAQYDGHGLRAQRPLAVGHKLLIASHQASRTGAPKALLHVLESLQSSDLSKTVVLREPGPLIAEFQLVADHVWVEPLRWVKRNALRFRLHHVPGAMPHVEELIAAWVLARLAPHLVYVNTVAAAGYVAAAVRAGIPAILHCHEVDPVLSEYLDAYGLPRLRRRFTPVACSRAVQDALVRILALPREQVPIVHEPVDIARVRELTGLGNGVEGQAKRSGAATVVAACGVLEARKGPDLWLEMAARVSRHEPEAAIQYWWVGGAESDLEAMRELAQQLGVDEHVWFAGERENPFPLLATADIFTLTSRFDPFPLAALEAMALAKPVVAFAVDGMPEMLGDCGVLVPPGDTEAMAGAVAELARDADRRTSLGARAARRAAELYDISRFRAAVRQVVADALPAWNGVHEAAATQCSRASIRRDSATAVRRG